MSDNSLTKYTQSSGSACSDLCYTCEIYTEKNV